MARRPGHLRRLLNITTIIAAFTAIDATHYALHKGPEDSWKDYEPKVVSISKSLYAKATGKEIKSADNKQQSPKKISDAVKEEAEALKKSFDEQTATTEKAVEDTKNTIEGELVTDKDGAKAIKTKDGTIVPIGKEIKIAETKNGLFTFEVEEGSLAARLIQSLSGNNNQEPSTQKIATPSEVKINDEKIDTSKVTTEELLPVEVGAEKSDATEVEKVEGSKKADADISKTVEVKTDEAPKTGDPYMNSTNQQGVMNNHAPSTAVEEQVQIIRENGGEISDTDVQKLQQALDMDIAAVTDGFYDMNIAAAKDPDFQASYAKAQSMVSNLTVCAQAYHEDQVTFLKAEQEMKETQQDIVEQEKRIEILKAEEEASDDNQVAKATLKVEENGGWFKGARKFIAATTTHVTETFKSDTTEENLAAAKDLKKQKEKELKAQESAYEKAEAALNGGILSAGSKTDYEEARERLVTYLEILEQRFDLTQEGMVIDQSSTRTLKEMEAVQPTTGEYAPTTEMPETMGTKYDPLVEEVKKERPVLPTDAKSTPAPQATSN